MIKSISTLLILFSTLIINGQNAILLKNFNPKAQDLEHTLNATKDSLILGYEKSILNVEIFNEDYEKKITVEDTETQISLSDLPAGKFVVHAKLEDKIIVMGILKRERINDADNSNMLLDKGDIAEGKGMMLDESLNLIKNSPKQSIEFILTRGKPHKQATKKRKFYWISFKINNESGSVRTMRLADQKSVDKLISRNKKEHASPSGKINELIVWEVYNTSKFMELQMSNPEFIKSITSEFFNVTPYYKSVNSSENI
ncbi:hypothetical protein FBALC1_14277 [Flavobacteriales bacterium ALC-1]|nr:hypothetical protein FBALC1_14277 [Flavobacteriales bacterium ALC-1]